MSAAGRAPRWLLPWLAGATAVLWIAYAVAGGDAVLGQGWIHDALRSLAVVAAAVLGVAVLAEVILSRAIGGSAAEPTAFMRVIVYGVLTFAATFFTLRFFGFDVRAVLATSAIATAAVGFAMQPTLGGMISGLALHLDQAIQVGDGVLNDGEWVEVTSLGWRAVVGRTTSGRRVVIPNARLSDSVTQVAPGDKPTEALFHFLADVDTRPDLISDLVGEMMIDLPLVEESLPVLVAPVSYQPRHRALRYRVKYWIRRYAQADDVQAEAHRRLWYVFQRNALAYPVAPWASEAAAQPPGLAPETVERLVRGALGAGAANDETARRLRKAGDLLLFAADEYLIAPPRVEGRVFLILQGEAETRAPLETLRQAEAESALHRLGRTAAVRRIAEELARYIGPYAEFAVGRAARTAPDTAELCRAVALEIADPNDRETFLEAVWPEARARFGPGQWLDARRDAAGSLICGGGLRARRETALLAVPPALAAAVAPPAVARE